MKSIMIFFFTFVHFMFWVNVFIRNYIINNTFKMYFSLLFWISIFISIVMILVTMKKVYNFKRKEYKIRLIKELDELKEKQKNDIELSIQNENERMKDNFNILASILELLKNNDFKTANNLFRNLYQGIQNKDTIYYCDNSYVNAVLYNKKLLAIQFKIHIRYDIKIPNQIDLDVVDLPAVLFNILDNGIKACKECINGSLELDIKYNEKYISIYQRNSYNESSNKEDFGLHGYGLKIVEEIAEKYDGICQWSKGEECFESRIMIKYRKEDFNHEICNS